MFEIYKWMRAKTFVVFSIIILSFNSHLVIAENAHSQDKKKDKLTEFQYLVSHDSINDKCTISSSAHLSFHGQGSREVAVYVYKTADQVPVEQLDSRVITIKSSTADLKISYNDLKGGETGDNLRLEWYVLDNPQWGRKDYYSVKVRVDPYCNP